MHFWVSAGLVCAVDGVKLTMPRGAFHPAFGEAGCGKATLACALARTPKVLIRDESFSTLDVSVSARNVNLFVRLQAPPACRSNAAPGAERRQG